MNKRNLHLAGIVAAFLYLLADIIGHIIEPGYFFVSNAVSELSESGADHRLLFSIILVSSSMMGILFGLSILSNFRFKENKLIFLGGTFLTVMSICTALTATIFPMDPVGSDATFPGTMHLVLVGLSVLMIFPAVIVLGIGIKRKFGSIRFRNFSFITLGILVISGGMSPIVIANWEGYMGLIERINVYTYFIWIIVLSIFLLRYGESDN
jgi:hypothetical membrane protein